MTDASTDAAITTPDSLDLLNHYLLRGDETAEERRHNAWRFACRRLDIDGVLGQMPWEQHQRYYVFVHEGHARWIMSRASGVALIVIDADTSAWLVERQRRENARRDLMTREVCQIVAMAMLDSVYLCLDRKHRLLHSSQEFRRFDQRENVPSYTTLRDHLAFECGASYLIACEVAFARTAREHAIRVLSCGSFRWEIADAERGWL